ncbi:deacetylase, histone deacetylase/acetoin utilization protein [Beggiatoa alba B18LD]|uniref:Deacetylase, histone deacetylase/acetoin utilization protein n=1 Tax=Beggiatoa alba B18LD TaxID=395493 RepID=I3CDM3_9GAMM|nr:histone deacetylase [Beggiatoa alba]EIJ41716.1 deacetylase, histone deacetylase/acetoin utilization protein [Beggiatoa alba B18LD]
MRGNNSLFSAMDIFYTDIFPIPLPATHRFPMEKYALLRQQLVDNSIISPAYLQIPPAATLEQLIYAHTPDYIQRVFAGELTEQEIKIIGFPWSTAMVERSRRSCGATIQACYSALKQGIAVSLAGGTHHAYADHGQGYCVFNDSAVSARLLKITGWVKQVVIIDCDVHQGNGTAHILADDNDLFTFSIHGAKNFPFRKEKSNLDIELSDNTGDDVYLKALEQRLKAVFQQINPDLVIYLAGADPYQNDRLGRLALTKAGLESRDMLILEWCRRLQIPVAITMAGGYGKNIQDTVDIHLQTVKLAVSW